MLATMMLHTAFTFAESFSPSWTVLCIFIFLRGFGQMSTYIITFVLGKCCNIILNNCTAFFFKDHYHILFLIVVFLPLSLCAGSEIFTGSVRLIFSSMGVCLSFALAYMILPLIAYFLRDWHALLLVLAVISLPYFIVWW